MKQKVVVGGFASDKKQIEKVSLTLSEHFDEDVIGLNFREARQTRRAFFDGRDVITHSAGMMAILGSIPKSVIAVAPPIPEPLYKLLWRGAVLGRKLRLGSRNDGEPSSSCLDELVHHARSNFGALPDISSFDALQEARWYQFHNVPTTVVLMNNDSLFRLHTPAICEAVERAQRMNVRVVTSPGEHVRFTHDPVGVLGSMAVAESMAISV